jgi:acyl-CoA thioesterase
MYAKDAASQALGIRVDVRQAGRAVARMTVRQDMVNGFGVCHGGLLFTLADTAFAFACNAYDDLTFAAAASIDFLRPARLGDELQAIAREDYRGGRTGFYTVDVVNQRDETVALFRGRSASRGERLL